MSMNRVIQFRVKKDDFEKIRINALGKGFPQMSDYLRSLALDKNRFIEDSIIEMNRNINKILEILEN